ncbi:MAG: disulfide bond formation protein DsbA [Rhizobiales bacterium 65-9]|nr:thioredoxin domain-containing protein [Hyphomicrobiales bacterium]OJY35333.1 MAG: disulfide bond formation protein DsbA [Rhizobiales bacterium 65-9]
MRLIQTIAAIALSAAALGTAPALAQQAQSSPAQGFNATQKLAIEAIIKEYLMRNPEILRDALMELESRQRDAEKVAQKQALEEQRAALLSDQGSIVVGNPQGDVTLIEFFDYNCGYCKKSLADMQSLVKNDPKLRVVLRDFPILGPDSVEASKIATVVKQHLKGDKYFDFHVKLMSTRGRAGKERALEAAKEAGLDPVKIAAEAESPAVVAGIQRTLQIAEALSINGTPAFIIGDEVIAGAVGEGPMKDAIKSVRQCGKAQC